MSVGNLCIWRIIKLKAAVSGLLYLWAVISLVFVGVTQTFSTLWVKLHFTCCCGAHYVPDDHPRFPNFEEAD